MDPKSVCSINLWGSHPKNKVSPITRHTENNGMLSYCCQFLEFIYWYIQKTKDLFSYGVYEYFSIYILEGNFSLSLSDITSQKIAIVAIFNGEYTVYKRTTEYTMSFIASVCFAIQPGNIYVQMNNQKHIARIWAPKWFVLCKWQRL